MNNNTLRFSMSVPATPSKKLHRVQWTQQLHERFIAAVNKLGDYAVPSKILKEMNVPGLTREQISSHLQKYRLKKDSVHRQNTFFAASANSEPPPATLSSMSSSFSVSELGKRKSQSPQAEQSKKEKVSEDVEMLKSNSQERLKNAIELYNKVTSLSNIVNVPTTLNNTDLAITNLFNEVCYQLSFAEFLLKEQRNVPAVISILELITTTLVKESNTFIEKFVDEALKECGRLWMMVMLNWTGSTIERKAWYDKLKRLLSPYNVSHEMFDYAAYAAFIGWEDENLIAILDGKQPSGKFNESDELLKCRAKVLRLKGALKEAEILEKLLAARFEDSSQQQQSPVKPAYYPALGPSRSPSSTGGSSLPSLSGFSSANSTGAGPGGISVLLPVSAQQMSFPSMPYPPMQFPHFIPASFYPPSTTPVLFPILPPPTSLMPASKSGSPVELQQSLISAVGFSPATSSSQFSSSASSSAFLSPSPTSPSHTASSSPSTSVTSSPVRDSKEPSFSPQPSNSVPSTPPSNSPTPTPTPAPVSASSESPSSKSANLPILISHLTSLNSEVLDKQPTTQTTTESRSSEIARK